MKEEDEPEEEDEEEMGHAETYAEYMPIKCMSLGFVKIMKDFWVPFELKKLSRIHYYVLRSIHVGYLRI